MTKNNDFTAEEMADMSNEELTEINRQKNLYHSDGKLIDPNMVEVELDFSDAELKQILSAAEEKGMSLEQYVNYALEKFVEKYILESNDDQVH